jgi:hypothetical protein
VKAKPCPIKAKIEKARSELRALESRLKGGRGKASIALKAVIAQAKTSLGKAEALAKKKCAEIKRAPPKALPKRTALSRGEPKFQYFPKEGVWRFDKPPKPGISSVFRSGPRKGTHKSEGLALLQQGAAEYPTVLKERKKRQAAEERKTAKRLGRKVQSEGLSFFQGLIK